MLKIKKNDKVKVIAGKDKDKVGKVLAVDAKKNTVIVEGCGMIKKHSKPSMQNQAGGIIEKEGPIHISNVMLMDGDKTVRVGFEIRDGKKVRVAKQTGNVID